jgi:phage head maturation protease
LTLIGRALCYNRHSAGGVDGQPLTELVLPGAFAEVARAGRSLITGKPVALLINHDRKRKLTDTSRGLRLIDSPSGLFIVARGVRLPARACGLSVGLRALEWRNGRGLTKELVKADLREVSIITRPFEPAHLGTWIFEVEDESASVADLTRY